MNINTEAPLVQPSLDQEVLFNRITNRIRQSLELQEILDATVTEVRSFLGTDRVMLYRFYPDSSGKVIAQSIQAQRLPSLLGLRFPADDIPPHHRELLLKSRQRSFVDVPSCLIGLSPLDCLETGEPLASVQIHYRSADPCHIQYLTAMGVQSSLVVPILHRTLHSHTEPLLWGLLVSHHAEARVISAQELQVVQRVADQVSIAIAQANLLQQARLQAQREATVNQIASQLHGLSKAQFQSALEETVAALQGSGGRLYLRGDHFSELYICGNQPGLLEATEPDWLEQHPDWQHWVTSHHASQVNTPALCAIADLNETSALAALRPAFAAQSIRSVLTLPLQWGPQSLGYLTVFRSEICTETLWAGQVMRGNNGRIVQPRASFEAWREVKTRQAYPWTADDLALAQALNHHFSATVQQYSLYRQVQTFNVQLEEQVQARTTELQQSWKADRAFKQITTQIRRTLDLQKLLRTIVQEVLVLIHTDRVMIYQFTNAAQGFAQGAQGRVVIEAINGDWIPLLGRIYQDECFPRGHAQLYQEGRIRVVEDVAQSNLSPCHIKFLLDIQVQANLVVPIRIGTDLWGLLIAHECRAPRKWQSYEVDLLLQLADQAAIAIQQAELFAQSQKTAEAATAQAQQLEQALRELKQTQTQLIQTEKMSSLGQLVAGVAHEINNPVNFIYGNIAHVDEYMQDLLRFIHLFRHHYPEPVPALQSLMDDLDLDFLVEDLPKTLNSMQVGAERIRQIVLSLRNFSRLDEAEKKPVNLHEGIDSTLLILQHRWKSRSEQSGIKVVKEYGQLPLIECYVGQLNQVFMNIISNAIDALDSYAETLANPADYVGILTIQTQLQDENWVTIAIRDNGPGMTESVRKQLFDPFFTTKPIGSGTGLGLSISYQIVVERHGGTLECESAPGQGTTFLIKIPLHQS